MDIRETCIDPEELLALLTRYTWTTPEMLHLARQGFASVAELETACKAIDGAARSSGISARALMRRLEKVTGDRVARAVARSRLAKHYEARAFAEAVYGA
jgi:hypothetical protein